MPEPQPPFVWCFRIQHNQTAPTNGEVVPVSVRPKAVLLDPSFGNEETVHVVPCRGRCVG